MERTPHSVVIHGHFYQPPREDPWSGQVEGQASAAPYHDWNARIEAECYRPIVAARVAEEGGQIRAIVNTLRFLSFNFGPTLLNWMEKEAPDTYSAILEADAASHRALGHGNAVAQAYHHAILPLASRRDKVTEVRWGMEDFRRRFRREPAGMWMPETAVDDETLDVMAQEGLAFTIVAPHQVDRLPERGLPGLYRTREGRNIALFVYHGPLSHGVAFGSLLKDAGTLALKLARERPDPGSPEQWGPRVGESPHTHDHGGLERIPLRAHLTRRLVSIATDGETYGHHHRFGEMALAAAFLKLEADAGVRVENFASFLAHSPPREVVGLVEPSSWSCSHGVDRWRRDCGCKMDPSSPTQQLWRSGLRDAMDGLAREIHQLFTTTGADLLRDPWEARDAYGRVVTGSEGLEAFLESQMHPQAFPGRREEAHRLLELERQSLRLFTSCAWFFDDLAGIEPRQILSYADRALELMGEAKPGAESRFLGRLRRASTNETPSRDGETLFLEERELRELIRSWTSKTGKREQGAPPDTPEARLDLALEEAVRSLGAIVDQGADAGEPSSNQLFHDIRRLAYFHHRVGLPISFDAQTDFYRTLKRAPNSLRQALGSLRKPLGFTTNDV